MERWIGRVVVVTGASVGIGAEISKALVEAGMNVVGAARGVEKIQALADSLKNAKGSLTAIKCDLTNTEDIYNLFNETKRKFGGVDICVNNAAFAYDKDLLDGTPDEWRKMMDVNVIAVCLCTKLAIQSMRERGVDDGQIINISSNGGRMVLHIRGLHFYSATKHALNAITEGLRQEMRQLKSHIRISLISPGAVETEFAPRMYSSDPEAALALFRSQKCLEAKDIAREVIHVISVPAHVEINDVFMRPTEQAI